MRRILAAFALVTLALPLGSPSRSTRAAESPCLPGLSAPVRVVTDAWGIPHLRAANLGDLDELWGWVTARDRLTQLVMQRAEAEGTAHRWLGNDALQADGGAQLFRLRERADAIWARDRHDALLREELERYSAGINAWLDDCRAGRRPWPRDLAALHAEPRNWRPEDCVMLLLGLGVTLDLGLPQIAEDRAIREHGAAWFARRHRFEGRYAYATIPPGAGPPEPATAPAAVGSALPPATARLAEPLAGLWPARAEDGSDRASNEIVVGRSRSASGKPLLANDPHLALTAPGPFHVVHISVPGVVEAAGACVTGLPAIVSGRNTRCAWGVTALQAPVIDVYADTIAADGRHVKGPHGDLPVVTSPFDLRYRVLGVPLPVFWMQRRYGPHGPVLVWDTKRRLALSARWSALEDGRVTLARLVGIERSRDAAELAARYATLVTPTINLVAADVDGATLYRANGLVPRRDRDPGPGVLPGDGRHEWNGFIPADSMPQWRVPADGYAVNANNLPAARSPYAWPRYAWAHDRALRMAQRLEGDRSLTAADLMSVQNDVHSRAAERQLPALVAALGGRAASLPARARAALDSLRGWDDRMVRSRVAPTIARAWWGAYLRRSALDGVPALALAILTGEADDPLRSPAGARETPAEASAAALVMATDTLAAKLGPDPGRWTWARAHQARFEPPAGRVTPADLVPPPTPADGDGSTPCVGGSYVPWSLEFGHGPAFRHVVDLADSLTSWVVIPPWNAARPGGTTADLRAAWVQHAYLPLRMDWTAIERTARDDERFAPSPR